MLQCTEPQVILAEDTGLPMLPAWRPKASTAQVWMSSVGRGDAVAGAPSPTAGDLARLGHEVRRQTMPVDPEDE